MAHADCLPPGRPSRSRNVGRAGGQPSAARRRRVQLGAAGLGREEWHAPGGVGETPRARCPWVVAAAASRRETRRARMRHALRTVMRLSDALKTCRAACVAASRQRVGWGRSISDGEELGTLQGGQRAWMGSPQPVGCLLTFGGTIIDASGFARSGPPWYRWSRLDNLDARAGRQSRRTSCS